MVRDTRADQAYFDGATTTEQAGRAVTTQIDIPRSLAEAAPLLTPRIVAPIPFQIRAQHLDLQGADGNVVPELVAATPTRMGPGAEMREVTPTGADRVLAVLNGSGHWVQVRA